MKVTLYSQDGSKKGEVTVPEKIFGHKPNAGLVHKILVMQMANRRSSIAHTKTKGEVRGGGKKPHAQKHTGWARQGSTRNPHMRGGGVAFGPRSIINHSLNAPKKERRAALFSALSSKFTDGHIAALESYDVKEVKTKPFASMLSKMPFDKKILFVLPAKNEVFLKSSRNIPRVKTITVNYLNVTDVLGYKDVVFLKDALPQLEKIYV